MPEKTNQNIDRARKLGSLWCVVMHDSPTWPIHGEYRCRTCGRQFPVPWAAEISVRAPLLRRPSTSFRSAVLPIVLVLALLPATAVQAAGTAIVETNNPQAMAFARYIAG